MATNSTGNSILFVVLGTVIQHSVAGETRVNLKPGFLHQTGLFFTRKRWANANQLAVWGPTLLLIQSDAMNVMRQQHSSAFSYRICVQHQFDYKYACCLSLHSRPIQLM